MTIIGFIGDGFFWVVVLGVLIFIVPWVVSRVRPPRPDDVDPAPIPRSPLSRWQVYQCKMAVVQPEDDVLLVHVGVYTKIAFYAWAGFVCWYCHPFALDLVDRILKENHEVVGDILIFEVGTTVVLVVHLLLVVATLLLSPIRFDRGRGTVGRGGLVPGAWSRDLDDLICVQVCHGKAHVSHGDRARDTRVKLQYQVNLVFRGSPPTRHNLSEHGDLPRARQMARQIAKFVDKPVLNYVAEFGTEGRVGAEAKADAEARELLA